MTLKVKYLVLVIQVKKAAYDININQVNSDLVKEPGYNVKILDIENKLFTTSEYNKFKSKIIGTMIKQK